MTAMFLDFFFYLQIQVTQFLIELISCDLTSIFKITLSIEPLILCIGQVQLDTEIKFNFCNIS